MWNPNMSSREQQLLIDEEIDFEYDLDFEEEPFLKECPYCKGTGISRDVEADCLTCWGEGYI